MSENGMGSPAAGGKRGDELLLVTFEVCGSLFALDASGVLEVIRLSVPTRLFRAPEEVVGVINLRGRIVTVLDLGKRLGLDRHSPGPDNRVFILEDRNEPVGLLVDRVADVVPIERGWLEPPPVNVPAGQSRFYSGICRVGDGLITVLDSVRVLAREAAP